jgi:flagellar L-ring protein precursor FlgH
MSRRVVLLRCALLSTAAVITSGCSSLDRLKNIGEQPPLSAIDNPTTKPAYKPVQMPMPTPQPATYNPNSLWRNGSRAFFKDQRAHQVGDILTVKVNINDTAQFANETQRSRTTTEDSAITNFLGANTIANPAKAVLPGTLLNSNGDSSTDGKGSINRQEELQTNVAAVVTQALPNGNLVIEGKQEIKVNFEIRELIVAGIVRPEDIDSDNTIDLPKIAEARVAYGGRGQITDFQQAPYGQQLMDVVLPF